MSMLTEAVDHVIGVDPDRDRLTIAVIDAATTGVVARVVVGADPAGYREALAFAAVHSSVLAQVAADAGERVVGFDRPEGRAAKDGAKSDVLDAVRAARELLGREQWAQPRARGAREAIRVLLGCRNSAQRARTAAINELKALVVTCRPELREQLRHLSVATSSWSAPSRPWAAWLAASPICVARFATSTGNSVG
jgi:hypothetical protein